jgi:hypothetical protein
MGIQGQHRFEKTCARHLVKLSVLQKSILLLLARVEGRSMGRDELIASLKSHHPLLQPTPSNLSRAITALVKRGLVDRLGLGFYRSKKIVRQLFTQPQSTLNHPSAPWVWVGIPESQDSVTHYRNFSATSVEPQQT